MNLEDFFNAYSGKHLNVDNVYGPQCVDVIKAYYSQVLGIKPMTGNAIDYWDAKLPEGFVKIVNSPSNKPEPGDIIIWGTKLGQYGHIAIAAKGITTSKFTSFDQNYPQVTKLDNKGNVISNGSPCHFQDHTYSGVLGWLRPSLPANPTFMGIALLRVKGTSTVYSQNQSALSGQGYPQKLLLPFTSGEEFESLFGKEGWNRIQDVDDLASHGIVITDVVSSLRNQVNDFEIKLQQESYKSAQLQASVVELSKENSGLKEAAIKNQQAHEQEKLELNDAKIKLEEENSMLSVKAENNKVLADEYKRQFNEAMTANAELRKKIDELESAQPIPSLNWIQKLLNLLFKK